jgi:hypothetical protein
MNLPDIQPSSGRKQEASHRGNLAKLSIDPYTFRYACLVITPGSLLLLVFRGIIL